MHRFSRFAAGLDFVWITAALPDASHLKVGGRRCGVADERGEEAVHRAEPVGELNSAAEGPQAQGDHPNAALLQGRPGYTRLMALERQLRCQRCGARGEASLDVELRPRD